MRARKNDVHIPLSYGYAERLLAAYPDADEDVVLLGILLHDVGWAVVDQEAIYRDAFGPGMMESDVRIAHEKEGARLARAILEPLGYAEALVDEVAAIIDGHDTRRRALSHNDELVKDADRLWRFGVTGVSVACDWFALTPREYAERLVEQFEHFFTPAAEEIARAELDATRRALRIEDL
jgi:HD superfamily phosphodiesterase